MLTEFEGFVQKVILKVEHDSKFVELTETGKTLNMHLRNVFVSKHDSSSHAMINFVKHLIEA